jgi:hypothetical protein
LVMVMQEVVCFRVEAGSCDFICITYRSHSNGMVSSTPGEWMPDGDAHYDKWGGQLAFLSINSSCASAVGAGYWSNRSYGWADYVRTALRHCSFRCRHCGCVVKYCCSVAVLIMLTPFGGGQWMSFPRFGGSYSFWMSRIFLGAWAGRLLSAVPTGLPVFLIG